MFNFNVSRNLFAVLEDEEGEIFAPKPLDTESDKDWSHLPWEKQPNNKKKQQEKKKQETPKPKAENMRAKPLIHPAHVTNKNRPNIGKNRTSSVNGTAKQTRVEDVSSEPKTLEEKKAVQLQRQRRFPNDEQAKMNPEPTTPSSEFDLGDSEQFPGLRGNV